jgi:hypothetical protein
VRGRRRVGWLHWGRLQVLGIALRGGRLGWATTRSSRKISFMSNTTL